jgi:large subunit ribosomal protein L10
MKSVLLLVAAAVGSVAAFAPTENNLPATRRPTFLQGGGSGYATSLEGKKETVAQVKDLLDSSNLIFSIPASSLTVAESRKLRQSMPETTTIKVIKNKLMARAIEDSSFTEASQLLTGANMWFFVEEEFGATIKAYKSFIKENGKTDSHKVYGGVMDETFYDANGVDAIGNLPSRDELYAKIAGSIKAVPTKVARVINAPNSKLARAIKLAGEKQGE